MTYAAGLLRRLAGAAQDGADPLPARPDVLSRQRVDARRRTARRSGPTTWRPTRCSSSWACAWIRWTRRSTGDLAKLAAAVPAGRQGRQGRVRLRVRRPAERQLQGGEPAARQGHRRAARRQGRRRAAAGRLPRRPRAPRPCWPRSRSRPASTSRRCRPPSTGGAHEVKRLRVGHVPALLGRQHGRGLDAVAARAVLASPTRR